MAKGKKQSLIGGALILTLSGIVVKLIGYIYNIPLTDFWLKGQGIGYYNVAYTLYLPIYTMAISGFPIAISKIVSQLHAQKKFNDVKTVKKSANFLFFILGITGSVLMAAIAKPYTDYISNPLSLYCMIAIAPSIFFSALLSAKRGYDQGLRNMTTTAVSQIVEVLVKTAFGLAACYFTLTSLNAEYVASGTVAGRLMASADEAQSLILALSAAVAIFAVTVSVAAGYLYFVIRDRVCKDPISKEEYAASPLSKPRNYYLKQILFIGIPIAVSSLVTSITGLIDTTMLQNLIKGVVETNPEALYAAYGGLLDSITPDKLPNFLYGCLTGYAQKLYTLIPTLTASFTVSALPIIAEHWAVGDSESLKRSASSMIRMSSFIAAPLGFGMCALAKPILRFVFSTSVVEVQVASFSLMVFGAYAVLAAACSPIYCIFNAIGRVDIPIKLTLGGAAIKILLTYLLVPIPSLNIQAAPITNIAYFLFILFVGVFCLRKYAHYKVPIFGTIIKPMFAGLFCGAFALLTYNIMGGGRIATLAGICVGGVAYIAACIIIRVLPVEDVSALPGGRKLVKILSKLNAFKVYR